MGIDRLLMALTGLGIRETILFPLVRPAECPSDVSPDAVDEVLVRRARTADVAAIRALVDTYSDERRLLSKATVTLYEDVQEFFVADLEGRVVGCGALHVLWEDLAEVRTLAVDPEVRGRGIGHRVLSGLLDQARAVGVERVFCLTFETAFFGRHGFVEIDGAPVAPRGL